MQEKERKTHNFASFLFIIILHNEEDGHSCDVMCTRLEHTTHNIYVSLVLYCEFHNCSLSSLFLPSTRCMEHHKRKMFFELPLLFTFLTKLYKFRLTHLIFPPVFVVSINASESESWCILFLFLLDTRLTFQKSRWGNG